MTVGEKFACLIDSCRDTNTLDLGSLQNNNHSIQFINTLVTLFWYQ